MNRLKLVIGSRGSDLALWQANHVKAQLEQIGAEVRIKVIKTQGDHIQHLSLDKIEGKGFFTKELEEELLAGSIDIAVHSHKDLPTESPAGLLIAAVSEREDPAELILINKNAVDPALKFSFRQNVIVGTSSARRKAQLLSYRPDIQLVDIRGNVPTRIQKLREGKYDVILLAKAGVERLGIDLSDFHVVTPDVKEFIPAPAQGVLAIQIREDNTSLFDFLQQINSASVAEEVAVERKVLNLFEGGCHLPLGVYCKKENAVFHVWASHAARSDTFPKRLYYQAVSSTGLAEQIVHDLQKNDLSGKRVFISSDKDDSSYLYKALTNYGAVVRAESLIEISALELPGKDLRQFDSIFFNSRNAVTHFFAQSPSLRNDTIIAAFGEGTAAELNRLGHKVDFTGDSSSPQKVAEKFIRTAICRSVAFITAKDSLKSVESILADHYTVKSFPVYETSTRKHFAPVEADIYLFTSPSNVAAFFAKEKISPGGEVVAIGPSTAAALEQQGVKPAKVAVRSDENGMAEILFMPRA